MFVPLTSGVASRGGGRVVQQNREDNGKIGKAKERKRDRGKRRKGKSLNPGRHEASLQVQVPGWEIDVGLYIHRILTAS